MDIKQIGVHAAHCCKDHGCKYGDSDCPVANGITKQLYPCEDCESEEHYYNQIHDKLSKDGVLYKLGLDIHGVIDANPKWFSFLSKITIKSGGEVHIITGSSITEELKNKLKLYEVKYTHLFSITDAHKDIVMYDEKGDPWMDQDIWNRTKGVYCAENNISMHIDDSDIYGKYFSTPYLRYYR